jgi:hypothetical protein
MENNTEKKPTFLKVIFYVVLSLCLVFIAWFTILSAMAPSRKLDEMKKEFSTALPDKKDGGEKIRTDSAYLNLVKERAFLQSRIIMAETDSIYLTIDLPDSLINLEISGVVVHKATISSYKASSILLKGNENIISAMLATPFTISSDLATIKKEPVMLKMAPKDTSEYKPDMMPDTSIAEPVNYILEMTDGTRIYVYQQEDDKRADRVAAFRFDLDDRMDLAKKALRRVVAMKVPEYHPYIKIRLPRADAKIIYRALPKNGQIAVFL